MAQYLALLERDLAAVCRSWVARGWLCISGISAAILVLSQSREGVAASQIASAVQSAYLFLWSIVIIVLTAGAVSSETGVLADSVLSRPVKRYHYILAKLTARCLAVFVVFVAISASASYGAWRYASDCDVRFMDAALATSCTSLALLFLASLGVGLSTIVRSPLVSIVALSLLWYVAGAVFRFINVPYLSPFQLAANLPLIFQGELDADLMWKTPIGFLIPTVVAWGITVAHFHYKDV